MYNAWMTSQVRMPMPAALLETVVAYFNPRRVILFGSQPRGATSTRQLVKIPKDAV
jgi:hypothetical protein